MRNFLRQSIKGGRVCAFIQYYKSKLCEDILKKTKELNVNGNKYDIIDALLKYIHKHFKVKEKEYQSKIDDYRK